MINFYTWPLGWSLTTLGELVLSIQYGYTASATEQPIGPKFLRITDLQNNSVNWDTVPFCPCDEIDKYKLKKGDIVIARTGATTGKSFLLNNLPEITVFSSYLIRLETSNLCPPEYIALFMQSIDYWRQITVVSKGTAQPGANASILSNLSIPVPPFNEQRRIVAKIEALKARSQGVKEELEAIAPLLDQFRQSVLAAAFRGDLTADWREKNPDVEPASVLLERIRAERRRSWEEAELEKMKAQGKTPKDDKWKEKYEEPQLEEEALPTLPNGWCWLALDLVADAIDPQPSHRTPPEVLEGIPYVSIGDISDDETINFDGARKVSPDVLKEHRQRYSVKEGDFIFGKIGTLGKPIKLPLSFDYTLSANVILIQPKSNFLMSDWLFYFMKTPFIEDMLASSSRATSQAAFGIKRIRLMPILLPPLQEQKQILLKLESYLLTTKKLVSLHSMKCEQIDILNQSILAKAFRGELVPQDPNDEPASVLLERIHAEREKLDTNKKAKSKTENKSRKAKPEPEPKQLSFPGFE